MSLKPDESLLADVKPELATNLREFIFALKPEGGIWDMLVCTDGSGSTAKHPGGYAAVIVDRRKAGISVISGAMSNCTSQSAEVRAVFELANLLVAAKFGHRKNGFRVLLVTDSQYVASALKKILEDPVKALATKSHTCLWLGIQYAARVGIRIVPHYVPRNSNPLMTLADEASKAARIGYPLEQLKELKASTVTACQSDFPLTAEPVMRSSSRKK